MQIPPSPQSAIDTHTYAVQDTATIVAAGWEWQRGRIRIDFHTGFFAYRAAFQGVTVESVCVRVCVFCPVIGVWYDALFAHQKSHGSMGVLRLYRSLVVALRLHSQWSWWRLKARTRHKINNPARGHTCGPIIYIAARHRHHICNGTRMLYMACTVLQQWAQTIKAN